MDTDDFNRLVQAFDQEKAMAIAKAIERTTITPPAFELAIARFENRIDAAVARLDNKIDAAVAHLERRIDQVDAKIDTSTAALRTEIANTRTEIANTRAEMLKWMAGIAVGWVVAVAGVAFAIVRLATP